MAILDTLIKKRFANIIDNLDAEVRQDTTQFIFTIQTQRLMKALQMLGGGASSV